MNPKVSEYIESSNQWKEEFEVLRSIVLECGLEEQLKWKAPCYTVNNKNILMIAGFKEYCCISFFKGVLLKDELKILVKAGENSQSVRIVKFNSVAEINQVKDILKAYIFEAIDNEKAGFKVQFKDNSELQLIDELIDTFQTNRELETAFNKLTSGRQRAYNLFFESAKQSKTRYTRIDKFTQRILDGYGMNDCTCGLSKRMPGCDGSHKKLKN